MITETLRYEHIHDLQVETEARNGLTRVRTGWFWVTFNDPGDIDVRAGASVTLDLSWTPLSGVYEVDAVRMDGQGYTQVRLKYPNPPGRVIIKNPPSGITGQVYFGRRNVRTDDGGTATQVLRSDAGKVLLGLGLLSLLTLAGYSFFVAD